MRTKTVIIFIITFVFSVNAVNSSDKPAAIEEKLIRLEESQKALVQRIEDINNSLNKRIDDLREETSTGFANLRQDMDQRFEGVNQKFESMNQRFEGINQRFEDLYFWLQIIITLLIAIIAGLIAQFLWIWRRLVKVETQVEEHLAETEKDRLISSYREEIEKLKARIDRLEVT